MESLGSYCRKGGEEPDIPGLSRGRVQHYRRLVDRVVRSSLDSAYPITLAALEEQRWDDLIQEFFSKGKPRSPELWRLPCDFLNFHAEAQSGERLGLPWLDNLLYFEWMEIEVYNMPDLPFPTYTEEGDYNANPLAFNPECEFIHLEYPVHLYAARESVQHKGDYFVLILRSSETGHVNFINLGGLNFYIIKRLQEEEICLHELRFDVARMSGVESATYLDKMLGSFIRDLKEKGFVLGLRK